MVSSGTINSNTGGILGVQFNSLPQWGNYSQLYKQFCIRSMQAILVPRFTVEDMNNALGFAGSGGYTSFRMAYAISNTPNEDPPTSELGVLTNNGSKIVMGPKILRIRCTPKPSTIVTAATVVGGGLTVAAATRQRAPVWFNLPNGATNPVTTGEAVFHSGIRYWCSQAIVSPPAADQVPIYDIFYRVTVSLRDPL